MYSHYRSTSFVCFNPIPLKNFQIISLTRSLIEGLAKFSFDRINSYVMTLPHKCYLTCKCLKLICLNVLWSVRLCLWECSFPIIVQIYWRYWFRFWRYFIYSYPFCLFSSNHHYYKLIFYSKISYASLFPRHCGASKDDYPSTIGNNNFNNPFIVQSLKSSFLA